MTPDKTVSLFRIMLGSAWAAGLMVFGLFVLGIGPRATTIWDGAAARLAVGTALLAIAGAEFIFMVLVADALCPEALTRATRLLKALAAGAAWVAIGWMGWTIWDRLVA